MSKKYSKKSIKRKNRKYSEKSKKSACKRSYSRKRFYGGTNHINNTKNTNQINSNKSKLITTNSVDGIPIEKKAVIASSNSFIGTGKEYRNHKDYIDFQGKRDL